MIKQKTKMNKYTDSDSGEPLRRVCPKELHRNAISPRLHRNDCVARREENDYIVFFYFICSCTTARRTASRSNDGPNTCVSARAARGCTRVAA